MGRRIAVIGGDLRQITVAESLAKDGYNVSVYGFDKEYIPQSIPFSPTLPDAVEGCRAVVLGIAPCKEDSTIDTPFWKESLSASELVAQLHPECVIIGGKLSSELKDLSSRSNIRFEDYVNREDFAVSNAVPTAEGAIAIAMNELPITLHSSKCLVTGFGRISKVLARALHFLGADLTCTARKSSDIAWIKALGYKALPTDSIISSAHHYDLIFNTVPQTIFTYEVLRNIRSDTLIIDLASKPGGVDFDAAKQLDIKVIQALGLPGKCSPVTAGKIIKATVENILNEL
ncbi:MAG: dipicolinate synthase subunit DpsA [Clostridia bacterium]|nr:dipicolinate synthase subunit DpsA [Clostridia bacterium]